MVWDVQTSPVIETGSAVGPVSLVTGFPELVLSLRPRRLWDRPAVRPTPDVAQLVLRTGIGRSVTSAPQIEHL